MTPDPFTQQGRMRALGPKVSWAAGGDFIRVLSDDPFSSYFPRDVIWWSTLEHKGAIAINGRCYDKVVWSYTILYKHTQQPTLPFGGWFNPWHRCRYTGWFFLSCFNLHSGKRRSLNQYATDTASIGCRYSSWTISTKHLYARCIMQWGLVLRQPAWEY